MATGSRRRSATQWRALVQQWRRSGQSREEFADAEGVKATTLGWWASELARRSRAADSERKARVAPATFLPVRVVSDSRREAAPPPAPTQIELVLGERRLLRVPVGADSTWLARVVVALEEAGRC